MKSQTAAEVVAARRRSRARAGGPARGDLLVVCVVDEETGGGEGAVWLCREPPRRRALRLCCSTRAPAPSSRSATSAVYGVCVAEKGVFRFTVDDRAASPGHASMPRIGDNALLKMAPLLQAMGDAPAGLDVTETPRALLAELGLAARRRPGAGARARCASATRCSRCSSSRCSA